MINDSQRLTWHDSAVSYFIWAFSWKRSASPSCIRINPFLRTHCGWILPQPQFECVLPSFPCHDLAADPCRSQFRPSTLCGRSAKLRTIWPCPSQWRYIGHHIPKPRGQCCRGHWIVALVSALVSICGIVLVAHQRWLREDRKYRPFYGCNLSMLRSWSD